jgi:hypothetical protein
MPPPMPEIRPVPPVPEVVRYSPPGPQADFVVSSAGVCARNPAAPQRGPVTDADFDFEEIGVPNFYVSPSGAARSTLG